jgi:hypothetical protein
VQYAEHQEDREKIGVKRVESGIRNKLVEQAIKMFGIKDKFDVHTQTIHCCIHAERLEVCRVDDETLAFGHPVTIKYLRPENVFFLDETGDNTHGKDDRN